VDYCIDGYCKWFFRNFNVDGVLKKTAIPFRPNTLYTYIRELFREWMSENVQKWTEIVLCTDSNSWKPHPQWTSQLLSGEDERKRNGKKNGKSWTTRYRRTCEMRTHCYKWTPNGVLQIPFSIFPWFCKFLLLHFAVTKQSA